MLARLLFVLAAPLLLTGCLITPGKFMSELVLEKDGTFAFTYEGEIFFLGLSKLAQMEQAGQQFEPETCYDDEFEPRECTAQELADQRAQWDEGAAERAAKAKKDAEEMAAMMAGIDPTDPAAAEELRQLLLRHKGWNRVENKGNGVFDISFSTSGQLSHDMMFPVIEGFPNTSFFVQVILRDDSVVRVEAPGFAMQDNANPLGAMMGGMAALKTLGSGSKMEQASENVPKLDGTFTIFTDGKILANNTDEGPRESEGRSQLEWKVDQRTTDSPTALVKLGS